MKHGLVNLIPSHRIDVRLARRRRRGWIVSLAAQLSLMFGISIAARQIWPGGSASLAAELSDANQQIHRLNTQIAKQRRTAADTASRQALLGAIADKPDWSQLLKLIDQSVSDDIVIRQSQVQLGADRLTTLTLRGIAQSQGSVSQFVLRLQQTSLFHDIHLGRSEREPFMSGSAISFELICPLDGIGGGLP